MGKNKARHLLHGILDLLPLFVIPIFAIYTRNENYNSNIEVQVQHKLKIDFNQYIENDVNNDNYTTPNMYGKYRIRALNTFNVNDVIYYRFDYKNNSTGYTYLTFGASNYQPQSYSASLNDTNGEYIHYEKRATLNSVWTAEKYVYLFYFSAQTNTQTQLINFNLFNLTQMFGQGNEPSIEDFKALYPLDYYAYTESDIQFIDDTTITYNDTDVGSQFVYTLYNTVDKYFNMGNVFNMNDVYDWFILNIFGGNASMSIYIVWNIVLYEFVMDLLFLLYGLFMFFIDMCKRLMEKPLNSIK